MKQTSVEWLLEQLKINNYISDNAHWLIDDAKEMEREQIESAYQDGYYYNKPLTKEEYYEATFKK